MGLGSNPFGVKPPKAPVGRSTNPFGVRVNPVVAPARSPFGARPANPWGKPKPKPIAMTGRPASQSPAPAPAPVQAPPPPPPPPEPVYEPSTQPQDYSQSSGSTPATITSPATEESVAVATDIAAAKDTAKAPAGGMLKWLAVGGVALGFAMMKK